jgi:hypothetical protein
LLCKVYRLEYSFASKVCSKMIFFLKWSVFVSRVRSEILCLESMLNNKASTFIFK